MASKYYFSMTWHVGVKPTSEEMSNYHRVFVHLADQEGAFIRTQLELGEQQGSHHFQTAVKFRRKRTEGSGRKIYLQYFGVYPADPAQCCFARNPEATFNYSQKTASRVEGPWDFGVPQVVANHGGDRGEKRKSEGGTEQLIKRARLSVASGIQPQSLPLIFPEMFISNATGKELYLSRLSSPRDDTPVTVIWLYGGTSRGKSTIARLICEYASGYFCPAAYSMSSSRWMSGYCGEEVVFIDELEPHHFGKDMLKMMLRPGQVKIPTGQGGRSAQFQGKLILVTSQTPISDWFWPQVDRDALTARLSFYACPERRF